MIKHVWTVLARDVSIDATEAPTLTAFWAMGAAPSFSPASDKMIFAEPVELVSLWRTDSTGDRGQFSVETVAPDGRILHVESGRVRFVGDRRMQMTRATIPALPNAGPGLYLFRVKRVVDGVEMIEAEVALDAAQPKPAILQ
jgi:hypothetical protein